MTRPLPEVAADLDLTPDDLDPWGPGAAKLAREVSWTGKSPTGRLCLVSAITPTPAGEGKTTTAIGLADGLRALGLRSVVALREPSIAPVLGVKGGGTGTGEARLVPAERLDLHFTGDLHAVGLAHNTLAALVDDTLHRGRLPQLDPRRVAWRRAIDIGDRALRNLIVGLGGPGDGVPRSSGFDVTAASEIMAILALTTDPTDLVARIGRMIVGWTGGRRPVLAGEVPGIGAVAALLADALRPNLVQTVHGTPAFVHAGPFANIAHGCSSTIASRVGLARADWTVTEAGFGFDLGGEKFLHLAAPALGAWPDALVLVATVRALAHHGDGDPLSGLSNLDAHVAGARAFGLSPVIALNVFSDDDEADLRTVERALDDRGLIHARCTAVAEGPSGAVALARQVLDHAAPTSPRALYRPDDPLQDKVAAIARTLYGAADVSWSEPALRELDRLQAAGLGALPPCVAKTPTSLSDDPTLRNRPTGHTLDIHALRAMPGAGHVVVQCGGVRLMPGLPERPRAWSMALRPDGTVSWDNASP